MSLAAPLEAAGAPRPQRLAAGQVADVVAPEDEVNFTVTSLTNYFGELEIIGIDGIDRHST